MAESLRLFVGLDVGTAWTEALHAAAGRLAASLDGKGRRVRPELYHVTVVFLGNQPADAVGEIGAAIDSAALASEPFPLRLTQVERLGRHELGALVAAVLDPSGALQRFRARLERELRARSIRFEARPLVPHVTLLRPRRNAGPLPAVTVDLSTAPPLTVREVRLVRSTLSQSGPTYDPIHTASFDAANTVDGEIRDE
jgi:2'-5' RNA ligase